MTDFAWSVVLSLAAACMFGLGAQFARLGLRSLPAQDGAGISILSAFLLYWLVSPWYLEAAWWSSSVVWLFALVGLFRPALSTTFAMTGTAILGATISTTVASTSPFFGLVFGVVFLDEALTTGVALGTFGIIGGVMLLAWRGGTIAGNWPLWALLLPLGAAVIRVTAHLFTKIGMEEVASPFFAGLVAYTASLAIASANAVRRRTDVLRVLAQPAARWFFATGALYGTAVLALNRALQLGPLSVVAPLVALEALVVLALGVFVFREERITRRVIAGVVLVVAGTVAITAR